MGKANVIVQAGGQGTRMAHLTANKPKALVPFRGKPLLFHTLDLFPDADIVVIGDYRSTCFGDTSSIRASPALSDRRRAWKGYLRGGRRSCSAFRPDAPVLLSWCDLVYSDSPVPFFRRPRLA